MTRVPDLDSLFAGLGALDLSPLRSCTSPLGTSACTASGVYSVSLDQPLGAVQEALCAHDAVEWIEPVFVTHAAAVPDDPL